MNKRINALYEQAHKEVIETCDYNGMPSVELEFDPEKFAELIVKECINEIQHKSIELLDIEFYPHYQHRLKNYFGIK